MTTARGASTGGSAVIALVLLVVFVLVPAGGAGDLLGLGHGDGV
ncbi:hypothetical protein [Streptomyces sp. NPDC055681]